MVDVAMDSSSDFIMAIAYCLAYDRWGEAPDLGTVRRLRGGEEPRTDEERLLGQMLDLARLALQDPQDLSSTAEPTSQLQHIQEQAARIGDPQIALIMGGATKIKQYVFESARLPEIRGASGLLDRINLYDIPALFAKQPSWLREFDDAKGHSTEKVEAERLVEQVRRWFRER